MSGKILTFKKPESHVSVSVQEWPYPPVYRVRGYYHEFAEGEVKPSKQRAPVHYTFDAADNNGYANTSVNEIRCLDATSDHGWVVMREHETATAAAGYIDALFDMYGDKTALTRATFCAVDDRFFTLVNRKPTKDAPNRLLIYIAKYGKLGGDAAPLDSYIICHPDGRITTDSDILHPYRDRYEDC